MATTKDGLHLRQTKYIHDLLDRIGMSNCTPVASPIVKPKLLDKVTEEELALFTDHSLFRQTVGSLQYLFFTRPDVELAENKAAQKMHDPKQQDWTTVKHIIRYLQGTTTHGLAITKSTTPTIIVFFDAN